MISLEDCIAFSGLSEEEVAAIGEHEHIPQVAACALADYLLKQPDGDRKIRGMIVDDIEAVGARIDLWHNGSQTCIQIGLGVIADNDDGQRRRSVHAFIFRS